MILPIVCVIGVLGSLHLLPPILMLDEHVVVSSGAEYLAIRSTLNEDSILSNTSPKLFLVLKQALSLVLWLVLSAVTVLFGFHAAFIIPLTYPAVVGISNLLIHARVGLGWVGHPNGTLYPTLKSELEVRQGIRVNPCQTSHKSINVFSV
ncbi:hypothetical protein R3P38DRAFT_2792270 [Favolaschia claudopus]|uniref:Uncharacterized protein n=1 Tax=Favolaschia claudopus TaxID=2862362 RepID=A0AAW0AEW6_9AGAR